MLLLFILWRYFMLIEHLNTHCWEPALRGMRNPKKSHYRSDSKFNEDGSFVIGDSDLNLMYRLMKAGPSHRKFLRMITITADVTATLKFFTEFDTYLHTVQNSTSQMHNNFAIPFNKSNFDKDIDDEILDRLNELLVVYQDNHSVSNWRKLIMNIPQSFLYTRTVQFNYEVFSAMYGTRKNHKLDEWIHFCEYLFLNLPIFGRLFDEN